MKEIERESKNKDHLFVQSRNLKNPVFAKLEYFLFVQLSRTSTGEIEIGVNGIEKLWKKISVSDLLEGLKARETSRYFDEQSVLHRC